MLSLTRYQASILEEKENLVYTPPIDSLTPLNLLGHAI